MVIENGDDPPLKITEAKAYFFERRLYFDPNGRPALNLYYGNQRLTAPAYTYSEGLRADENAAVASLGPAMRNAASAYSEGSGTDQPPRSAEAGSGCSARDYAARLLSSDPVYADAMSLERALNNRGFIVNCICASVSQNLFEGQKGAALYRTDHGDFEALFLPEPLSFTPLKVIEQQENGRYLYAFQGYGERSPHMDSAKPMDFIKHGNQLFVVWGGKQLAVRLHEAFDSH